MPARCRYVRVVAKDAWPVFVITEISLAPDAASSVIAVCRRSWHGRTRSLNPVRHARIVELLRDGVPFATACRAVGVSASARYEWPYRGWGTHPDRPPGGRAFAASELTRP